MGKTVAEKIFDAHVIDTPDQGMHVLRLDSVFCHEITTPTAINDLIARGKDTVFDPQRPVTVCADRFQSLSRNTPFDGWQVFGKAALTMVGGRVVFEDLS